MSETWLDRCESVYKNILNDNESDVKKQLKSYSRVQRYEVIDYLKNYVHDGILWKYIKMCIEGDFK